MLYRQILRSISSQPLPADTSRYTSTEDYMRNAAMMQGLYGQLSAQQGQMRDLLNPDQWSALENASLQQSQRRSPDQTVLLYGYQG